MAGNELRPRLVRSLLATFVSNLSILFEVITKGPLVARLQDLPEKFTSDELSGRATLLEKIDRAMTQVAAGEVYTTEEARQKLKEWSK